MMKKTLCLFSAILATTVLASLALAQDDEQPTESPGPRVIHQQNRDIVVGATPEDLNLPEYKSFDGFAAEHPQVVRALAKDPGLANSEKYLGEHPELGQFFAQHPQIKADFNANPGNYVPLHEEARSGD